MTKEALDHIANGGKMIEQPEQYFADDIEWEEDALAQPAQQALNKMAENARELGLDYEPDIPFGDNNPGLPWDEVPQAFNDWWNADYDPTGNPFGKDTHAYWAWAGWKAAEQPAQRKPLTHDQRFDLLTKFEPHKNKWEAPAILIDMVEAAHGIKENT